VMPFTLARYWFWPKHILTGNYLFCRQMASVHEWQLVNYSLFKLWEWSSREVG